MTYSSLIVIVGTLLFILPACGREGSEPSASQEVAAAGEPVAEQAPGEPCALIPLASWEEATGLAGLELDPADANTCDVLDDANARVAGSLDLLGMSIFEHTPDRFETEAVLGIGDEAYWVSFGPGALYLRQGSQALSIMVNPLAAEDHREAAMMLAEIAVKNL